VFFLANVVAELPANVAGKLAFVESAAYLSAQQSG
jgi:hypothetical protein